MMPASNKTSNKKKMQWSTVIRRPNFILPKRELSASKQDASQSKKGAGKVKNSPTILSKTKVSPFAVGTKSVDTSSTQEIPHSVVVDDKTASEQNKQTKAGSVATDVHAASTVRATAVLAPSIVHHGAHPPFAGVQSTFGLEHAVSRGKERPSEYTTISENDGLSLGRSFRLASALQERTNHVLNRKATVLRKHVHCEVDVLRSSEKSVTANGNANTKAKTKAKVKSDRRITAKDRPQDRPGRRPCPPFRTCYRYGKKVTMIDPNLMIFVIDAVSPETCDLILDYTSQHVRNMMATGNADKCWRALYTYTKMDIPCAEVPGLGEIMQCIMTNVVQIIGQMYEKPQEASCLRPRSWKEPHLLMYQKVRGKTYVQCKLRS
jgi:hypothetical protein